MTKYQQIMHGSTSELYINGARDELATKIEIKMTGDLRTVPSAATMLHSPSITAIPSRGPSRTRSVTAPWSRPLWRATAPA